MGKNLFDVLPLSEADAVAVQKAFLSACTAKTSTTVEYALDGTKYFAEITPLFMDGIQHEYFVKATAL